VVCVARRGAMAAPAAHRGWITARAAHARALLGPGAPAPPAPSPVAELTQRRARARVGDALDDAALVAGGQAAIGAEVQPQPRAAEGAVQQGDDLGGGWGGGGEGPRLGPAHAASLSGAGRRWQAAASLRTALPCPELQCDVT
jgi:hypothetical protein